MSKKHSLAGFAGVALVAATMFFLYSSEEPAYEYDPPLQKPVLKEEAAAHIIQFIPPAIETREAGYKDATAIDKIEVYKKDRVMKVFEKGVLIKSYVISLGFEPEGHKETQGDGKTPEGKYKIDGKNPHSLYYKNLGVSYPNDKDRANAKKLGKSPGGDIKIHGIGKDYAHIKENNLGDWTLGCIAVTNDQIDEIYKHTEMGTTIEIFP